MNIVQKLGRLLTCGVILGSGALGVLASPAGAIDAPATLVFKELEKGSTVQFVDNAPQASLNKGVASISPGDMLITTNPLAIGGGTSGKIRVICTATSAANTKHPDNAGFICNGIAKLPGGKLILVGEAREGPSEGAITGGSGIYAGARGSFNSRPGKGGSTVSVTLLE